MHVSARILPERRELEPSRPVRRRGCAAAIAANAAAVAAATVHRLEPVPKLWYAPQLLRWYVLDSLELDVP